MSLHVTQYDMWQTLYPLHLPGRFSLVKDSYMTSTSGSHAEPAVEEYVRESLELATKEYVRDVSEAATETSEDVGEEREML